MRVSERATVTLPAEGERDLDRGAVVLLAH